MEHQARYRIMFVSFGLWIKFSSTEHGTNESLIEFLQRQIELRFFFIYEKHRHGLGSTRRMEFCVACDRKANDVKKFR